MPSEFSSRWESILLGYMLTMGTIMVSCAISLFIAPNQPEIGFAIAAAGTFLAAFLFGTLPGTLALVLSGVAIWFFIVPPPFSWGLNSPYYLRMVAAYFAVGALALVVLRLVRRRRSLP
jgi:K+-sensing histidine kinase KdpD